MSVKCETDSDERYSDCNYTHDTFPLRVFFRWFGIVCERLIHNNNSTCMNLTINDYAYDTQVRRGDSEYG